MTGQMAGLGDGWKEGWMTGWMNEWSMGGVMVAMDGRESPGLLRSRSITRAEYTSPDPLPTFHILLWKSFSAAIDNRALAPLSRNLPTRTYPPEDFARNEQNRKTAEPAKVRVMSFPLARKEG